MPTYEYMCKKCGPFTQLRAMAECELPSACPECGARAPRVRWREVPRRERLGQPD
jgi:putative FmdB family regulatory protein